MASDPLEKMVEVEELAARSHPGLCCLLRCAGVASVPLAHDRSLRKSSCQGWKLRSRSEAGSAYGRPRPGETGVWKALGCWSSGERCKQPAQGLVEGMNGLLTWAKGGH